METYVILSTVKGSARNIDLDNPENPQDELMNMLEAVGGKLLHAWATLGRWDFIVAVEVPNVTAVRALVSAMPEQVQTETLRAFDGFTINNSELMSMIRKILGK
jgi:uncharacterized protein with GYD domain